MIGPFLEINVDVKRPRSQTGIQSLKYRIPLQAEREMDFLKDRFGTSQPSNPWDSQPTPKQQWSRRYDCSKTAMTLVLRNTALTFQRFFD